MANIQVTGVLNYMQSRFHTEGAGLTRFEEDFLNAVNMATRRINRDCDLETRISMIADSSDEIELSDEYFDVLCRVVAHYLIDMGQRPARGDEEKPMSEQQLRDMVDGIRQDILNQAQDADTDDTDDLVALGGLGS